MVVFQRNVINIKNHFFLMKIIVFPLLLEAKLKKPFTSPIPSNWIQNFFGKIR